MKYLLIAHYEYSIIINKIYLLYCRIFNILVISLQSLSGSKSKSKQYMLINMTVFSRSLTVQFRVVRFSLRNLEHFQLSVVV